MEQRSWTYTPLPEPVPITEQVWPEGTLPLVCTRTMAYMHEPYIRRCLEGLLMQRTTFPVWVAIHDDASTDGTAEIIREFEAKYPQVIKGVYQSENTYVKPNRAEYRVALRKLVDQGKYDAICEGDDYWTDPLKLQKQVQALEADPSVVGCFTDAWNEKNGERTSYMDGVYATRPTKRLLDQRDMVLGQNIPACTVVFRRSAWTTIPRSIAMGTIAGDTVRYVHITRKGPLLYLPEHTAVRIMHPGGVHSLKDPYKKIRQRADALPLLDELTDGRYSDELRRKRMSVLLAGWDLAERQGDRAEMKSWWRAVARERDNGWGRLTTVRNWMKAWMPGIERLLGR